MSQEEQNSVPLVRHSGMSDTNLSVSNQGKRGYLKHRSKNFGKIFWTQEERWGPG